MKPFTTAFLFAIGLCLAALLGACGDDGAAPTAEPSPTVTPDEATVTSSPSPTPQVTPTAAESPTEEPPPLTVTGLFTDPAPTIPDIVRSLGTKPDVPFELWDGVCTVLYDTMIGEETNLGEGSLGAFSPDSSKMIWAAGPLFEEDEVWLIDLRTMEKRSLGPGRLGRFVDDEHVVVVEPHGNDREAVDLVTGEREQDNSIPLAPDFDRVTTPDGHVLVRRVLGEDFSNLDFELTDGATGRTLLHFEAHEALPAGPGELVVATTPENGTTNIFIVEIATGQATFIATSKWSPPNWPLAANEQYVMWPEDYCGVPQGKTRLYDRSNDTLTELEASLWAKFTPDGLIAAGEFGARALIDPATLEYVALVPDRSPGGQSGSAGDVSWSPDYRYFSRGTSGGHGGLCMG